MRYRRNVDEQHEIMSFQDGGHRDSHKIIIGFDSRLVICLCLEYSSSVNHKSLLSEFLSKHSATPSARKSRHVFSACTITQCRLLSSLLRLTIESIEHSAVQMLTRSSKRTLASNALQHAATRFASGPQSRINQKYHREPSASVMSSRRG